ncbi:acyl-CoA dehydrogenase family protein [Pseudonocardia sp. CA-107938]|uniref:acyl-CoA dehydrogenase family protein n=1 Tax=Pseudonocardia sp. CA-107938 TaxID=3240021 RepID=UPI003D8BF306
MDFSPSELQRELAEGTRALLADRCPPAVVRAAWEKPGENGPLWVALTELGLPGALVSEAAGGLGLTVSDLLPALVETGRAAVPAPIVETALVAVPLLVAAGRADLVDGVVTGEVVATAAPAGALVPWTAAASHALVLDRAEARLVEQAELDGEPVAAVDGSRPLTRIAPGAGTPLAVDAAQVGLARARAALGAAAQLVGLGERQLAITVEYVSTRRQFGVPVGSFQAVKHHLADALLGIRFAEPPVRAAGLALDEGADPTRPVALAKALASDAADQVSRTAIQCHGAIGYTDEYDLQLYAKRTWALAAAWGTAGEHRAAYGDALGLGR